jgi:scyllo-inositol 2-dehydrogenase (NADP+)
MERTRVGIVGQGRSGHGIHGLALSQLPETYRIVAVCDPIAERTRDAETSHGAKGYRDWREMIQRDDLDLVVVAPPSHLHVPISTAALEAGHNVLCDRQACRPACG